MNFFILKIKGLKDSGKSSNMTNMSPQFDSEKWEKILKVKLCKGNEFKVLKSIHNIHLPRYILDFKARIILGKTQFNSQLAHWTNEYTSQACYMCQLNGDFEPATLVHMLYECPKAQNTIQYICNEFTLKKCKII